MSALKQALLACPDDVLVKMVEGLVSNELFNLVVDCETNPLVLKHQLHSRLDEITTRPYVQELPLENRCNVLDLITKARSLVDSENE